MILGDFNADGAYVTRKEMKEIRIRSDKNFHWLIGDDVDTTAKLSTDHTYDRHECITTSSKNDFFFFLRKQRSEKIICHKKKMY